MTSKIYQMKDGTVLAFPKTVGKAVENANGDTLENVEAGAQVNVVETIQLDGTAYEASNKVVNLPVYTQAQTDAKINSKIASAYKPGGTKTLATLPALTADNLGFVYNMSADFTTTADFVEGAGKKFKAGVDVGIVNVGTDENPTYKYNVLAGFVDTDKYDAHVEDTDVHVTTTDKSTWNGKQDAIADLATIRSNASAGKSASDTISGYGDIVTHDADEFLTEHQDISGKQDVISDLATIRSNASAGKGAADTIAEYGDIVTHDASEFLTEHQDISGKQDVISDLATIRSNASAGKGAADTIAEYGDIVSHNASEFLTQHQDISGKQDKITSSNKLSADLVEAGSTNAVVTLTEKSAYDGYASEIASKADATQTATALGLKANAADVYTKTQSDARYLTFEIVETYEA